MLVVKLRYVLRRISSQSVAYLITERYGSEVFCTVTTERYGSQVFCTGTTERRAPSLAGSSSGTQRRWRMPVFVETILRIHITQEQATLPSVLAVVHQEKFQQRSATPNSRLNIPGGSIFISTYHFVPCKCPSLDSCQMRHKRRKLQWFEHVTHPDSLSKNILQDTLEGGRHRGRHRKAEWTTSNSGHPCLCQTCSN